MVSIIRVVGKKPSKILIDDGGRKPSRSVNNKLSNTFRTCEKKHKRSDLVEKIS